MADAEFIVDIILRARDETAAAFAAAAGHAEAFNKAMDEQEVKARRNRDAIKESAEEIARTQAETRKQMEDQGAATDEILRKQIAVERQTKAVAAAEADANRTVRERIKAHRDLEAAQRSLYESLKRNQQEEQAREAGIRDIKKEQLRLDGEIAQASARRKQASSDLVAAVREENRLMDEGTKRERERAESARFRAERAKDIADVEHEIALEQRKSFDEITKINAATQRRLQNDAETVKYGNLRLNQLKEEEATLRKLEAAGKRYASALDPREAARHREELEKHGDTLRRLGADAKTVDQALGQAFDTRKVEQFARGQKLVEDAQKRITQQTKEYAREIDNLARLQRQRAEAAASGADVKGLRVLDEEINIAERKLKNLAAEIRIVSAQGVKIGVDVDTGEAERHLIDFEAVKMAVGRDIHLNVDVDAAAAIAKIEALQAATHRGMRGQDADISWWQQFTDSIEQSSNRVATFDNFIRGLVSLGIGVFFNQIIVLAGAAAGALTALAGSAIYAGGALGGALVAGIGQALPVLGLFATALSRITAVWKAAQQQQLLQQQTFARHAKVAKQSADATDAIKNAEDGLAQAHKRVKDAQQGVIDARQKAIRQLQDLILQERQAQLAAQGANLTLAESQEALRRAVSSGQTGDIARARLNVQEAQLGTKQAGLTSRRTSQDLATRRSQGIEGSPEVTQAKDQLTTAKSAADQAERSLAKAGRQMDVTGDQALTAAGKLNFMLSQLSDSERKLYDQFSTFIDRFRVMGGKMVAPIIDSVTHMMKRINGILADPGIIAVARGLSTQIATQLNRIFDHFTSGKMGKVFLDFIEEAGKNLRPLTSIIIHVGDAFLAIGKAASPALSQLLGYFAKITGEFSKWASSKSGQKALMDFFNEGVRQFKLWMGLLGSISRLILDVVNPKIGGGARTGANLLRDMTGAINKLDAAARSKEGRKFLQEFFENSRKALEALKPILVAVAQQFARLFDKEGVDNIKAGSEVIGKVLIPAFGDFLDIMGKLMQVLAAFMQIPGAAAIMRIGIAAAATATVIGKLHTIFTPFSAFIKVMPKALNDLGFKFFETGMKMEAMGGIVGKLGVGLQRFGALIVERIAPMIAGAVDIMFGPWGIAIAAVIAAIILLDRKFHFLGPTFDWVKRNWKLMLLALTGPLGPVIALISHFHTQITNAIKAMVNGVINFVKDHWKLAKYLIPGVALYEEIKFIGPKLLHALAVGFSAVWGWLKDLPSRFADFASSAADRFVDGFKSVGERILHGIVAGLKDLAGFGKDIANAFIDLFNNALPNKISMPGPVPDVNLPDNPIPHLASGGYIPGNYAEGDRYPIMVAGEEVVLNPAQQALLGAGRVMDVLRRTGGKFLRPGGSYASGGGPESFGTAARPRAQASSLSLNVDADNEQTAHKWRLMWQEMVASTRRNASQIEERVRNMRVAVDGTLGKFKDQSSGHFVDIEMSSKVHFTRMVNAASDSFDSLTKIVYRAMHYIGSATNAALRTLDADPVKFSLAAPQSSAKGAATGYLGSAGERGGDQIPIWVGRGEAVLNWAHQKMIEPALRSFYGFGLHDLFNHSHAYHAGGHQSVPGMFAKGGFTGPFGSGSAFTAVANFAKKKFGLTMTAGRTNHGYMTADGNVSDHSWGGAGDFSDGYNTPNEKAFNQFWKSKLPQAVKQLIFQGKDQLRGFPISDHFDHVHLALMRNLAFDAPRVAKLISRAMRGLNVGDLLAGLSGDGVQVDHIDAMKVKGKSGPFKTIIQKAINKVRSKANSYIDSKFSGGVFGGLGANDSYDGPLDHVFNNPNTTIGFSDAVRLAKRAGIPASLANLFGRIAQSESGLRPGVVNSIGATGLWQIYNHPDLVAKYGNMRNPWSNAQAAYDLWKGGGLSPWLASRPAWGRYAGRGMAPAFARGGFVGGMRRAATGLPGLLQGTRSPGGVYTPPDVLPIDLEGVTREFRLAYNGIRKALTNVRKSGKGMSAITKNLTEITKENGLFDQINTSLQRYTDHLALKLKEATFKMSKAGFVIQQLTPAQQAEAQINNMRDVLRKYRGNLNRINESIGTTASTLKDVNAHIDKLTAIAPKKRTKKQSAELESLKGQKTDLIADQRNLQDRAEAARQAIADQLEALYQAQLENFQKKTDAAIAGVTRNVGGMQLNQRQIEIAQRVATAHGDTGQFADLEAQRISVLKEQQGKLAQAAQTARARGYGDLADQYQQQFEDMYATIAEATAQAFQAQIDAVNNQAQRSLAGAQRKQDMAGILDRIGGSAAGQAIAGTLGYDPFGGMNAGQLRTQGLQDQYSALTTQRAGLQGLLSGAYASGNVKQIQDLTDQLADLDKSIADNIVAQNENTTAIRQSAIDAITARQQFQGGVFTNLAALSQSVATNTMTPDPDRQRGLLTQARGTIQTALFGLQDQLKSFGIDLGHSTGNDLVDRLKGVNFDQVEANLSAADKTQFETLINAIIDNGTQLESNTQQLSDLNGQIAPQGWQSTAWSWFRNAIFTGMGDVMPQYTVPSFDGGGHVLRTGLAKLHEGEYVAKKGMGEAPFQEGDINIEINEAGGVPDVDYVAKRMAFERRTARATR